MAQSQPEVLDLPVLPLRDVVVFPHMVIPLFVGRDKSMRALEKAMEADKRILLVAQKSAETDDPAAVDLHTVGTLAQVLQLLKLPDGTIKVLVEGLSRVTVDKVVEQDGALQGQGTEVEASDAREPREVEAIARSLMSLFEQYVKTNRKLPPELLGPWPASTSRVAWPTPLPRTSVCVWLTSSACWKLPTSVSGWSCWWGWSTAKSMCSSWKSASAAA